MSSDILNENQHRHYYVLLSMLAQSLARLDAIASAVPSGDTTFIAYDEDLPESFRERAEPHLRAARTTLAKLAETLRVVPKRLSRRRSIRAILVTEIVRIEDSLSGGLRGYGDVDPRVRATLDPMLQSVIHELQQVRLVLENRV